jgi:hypothetical protein
MGKRPDVKDTIEVARKGGKRSQVYEWLWTDFDELLPTLSRVGVNWDGLAELAISNGLAGGRGCTPTAETVRQTWMRVRRDKAHPPKRIGRPKASTEMVQPTEREPPPAFPPVDDEDDDKPPGGKFQVIPSRTRYPSK